MLLLSVCGQICRVWWAGGRKAQILTGLEQTPLSPFLL